MLNKQITLVEAIYEKYSEINGYCVECLGEVTASNDVAAVDASSPSPSLSSSSESSSPTSPPSLPMPQAQSASPTTTPVTPASSADNRVSFYIPSAYSPQKSSSFFKLAQNMSIKIHNCFEY